MIPNRFGPSPIELARNESSFLQMLRVYALFNGS
jgi:hypothetical protein